MNDTIVLADPAVSCDMAINIARRIDALALVLATALESPQGADIAGAVPEVLSIIRCEARRVRERVEDASDALRRA